MPRNSDPGDITVGTGLAAPDSIESNALVHPTGGNDGLRAHIQDPSRAHMASAIGVVDAGGLFVSDEVEGALQELAGGTSSGFLNGLILGGTFTSLGLNITLDTPTTVLLGGTTHDFSGATLGLTPGVTQYVYIDAGTATLTTALAAPALTTEPVLLWEITTDGAGVTGYRDARFFVRTIDRKPPFTVRSDGAAGNRNAEGCFESLEAAFLWLELYAGVGSTPIENHRILVRGINTLTRTYMVPVAGVIMEGDGESGFSTSGVVNRLFDLNGKDRVRFRNLLFIANDPALICIQDASGHSIDSMIENCSFVDGGSRWDAAVVLQDVTATNAGHIIRDTFIQANLGGIAINRPDHCLIDNCRVENVASGGSTAIIVGGSAFTSGDSEVRACYIDGFANGIKMRGPNMRVTKCTLRNNSLGISVRGGAAKVEDCYIYLDPNDGPLPGQGGKAGILAEDGRNSIRGCTILNPRFNWTATTDTPYGISMSGTEENTVEDCVIEGFNNPLAAGDLGYGVQVVVSGTDSDRCVIADTRINISQYGIYAFGANKANDLRVHNVTVRGATTGMRIQGDRVTVDDCTVTLDSTTGLNGISVTGVQPKIRGCSVTNPRVAWAAPALTTGVTISGGTDAVVSDSGFFGFWNTFNNTGTGCSASSSDRIKIHGCHFEVGAYGIQIGLSPDAQVRGCTINGGQYGIDASGAGTDRLVVAESRIILGTANGEFGVSVGGPYSKVSDCYIENPRVAWAAEDPQGVRIGSNAHRSQVTNCTVTGFYNTANTLGEGIYLLDGVQQCAVLGGLVRTARGGVVGGLTAGAGASGLRVEGVAFEQVRYGAYLAGNDSVVSDCVLTLDSSRGFYGIEVQASRCTISGCDIYNPRNPATYAIGDDPMGIVSGLGGTPARSGLSVDNCRITGFYNTTPSPIRGYGVFLNLTLQDFSVTGVTVKQSGTAFFSGAAVNRGHFSNCTAEDTRTAFDVGGNRVNVHGVRIDLDVAFSGIGLYGVVLQTTTSDCLVADCNIRNLRSVWVGEVNAPYGVRIQGAAHNGVSDCRVEGFYNTDAGVLNGYGIVVESGSAGCKVEGNTVIGSRFGIAASPGATDTKINDNTVDCSQIANSNGIQVTGTDAGGSRTYDITVNGNTVKACGAYGILLAGTVLDTVVDGNVVDMTLASDASNPTAIGIGAIPLGARSPSGIAITNNNVGTCTSGIEVDLAVTAIGYDYNISGNDVHYCAYSQTAPFADTFVGRGSKGIGVEYVQGLQIHGNTVSGIGSIMNPAGVFSFPTAGGPDVQSKGICLRNCTVVSVSNNTIRGLDYTGAGRANGIYIEHRGWGGGGPIIARDFLISENEVFWDTGAPRWGMIGIYVNVGQGTDTFAHWIEQLSIRDNTIYRTDLAGIYLEAESFGTLRQVLIESNEVNYPDIGAVGAGIYVTSNNVGGVNNADVRGVVVRNNAIRNPGSNGIVLSAGKVGFFQDLAVENNVIRTAGYCGVAVVAAAAVALDDVRVDGNTVNGLNGLAIAGAAGVMVTASSPATSIRNVSASRNVVISDSGDYGVYVRTTDLDLVGVTAQENVVRGNTVLALPGQGVHVECVASTVPTVNLASVNVSDNQLHTDGNGIVLIADGTIQRVVLADNMVKIEGSGGALSIQSSYPAPGPGGDVYTQNFTVTGNVLAGGATSFYVAGGTKVRNVTFADNIFRNITLFGLYVDIRDANVGPGPGIADFNVLGNTFEDVGAQGLVLSLGRFGAADCDDMVNVNVSDNQFNNCANLGLTTASAILGLGTIIGLTVKGNQFYGCCGALDSSTQATMELKFGSSLGSTGISTCLVSGNTLQGNGGMGILITDQSAVPATNWDGYGITVSDNIIQHQINDAIRLDFTSFTAAQDIHVADNNVRYIGQGSAQSGSGIAVLGPTTTPMRQLSIEGNEVHYVGNGASNGAIRADFPDSIELLSISDNNVRDYFGNYAAIFVIVDQAVQGAVIADNNINNSDTRGIYLDMTGLDVGAAATAVSITGNTLYTTGDHGIHIYTATTTELPYLYGLIISDNAVEAAGSYGIYVQWIESTEGLAIEGNTIRGSTGTGIRVAGSILATSGPLKGASIVGNDVISAGGSGIVIVGSSANQALLGLTVSNNTVDAPGDEGIIVQSSAANISALTVSGNAVFNWNQDGNVTYQDGIGVITQQDILSASVTGNSLRSDANWCQGFLYSCNGVARCLAMTGNSLYLGGTNTRSMYFDGVIGGTQYNLNITGNTFYGAVTGVSYGAPFAPGRSVCSLNVERTSGGAGNWGSSGVSGFCFPFTSSIANNNQD